MTTSQSTKITIEESKMMFGEFDKEKVFIIEKSNLYKSLGKGVKIAEFVLLQDLNKLIFLEAKSSSPRDTNKIRFDEFIDFLNLYLTFPFYFLLFLVLHCLLELI